MIMILFNSLKNTNTESWLSIPRYRVFMTAILGFTKIIKEENSDYYINILIPN